MFDKSLPFGTVHGSAVGVSYYQNGKYYDGSGNEVNAETGEIIKAKKEPPAPKGLSAPPPEPPEEPTEGDIVVDEVNLSAWARGEAGDVKIAKVKEAVEKHFGRKAKNADEALRIIKGEDIG